MKLKNYVADYSFIVRNSGYLTNTEQMDFIFKLPSYYGTYYLPAIGSFLPKTVCGATYGATALLVNDNPHRIMNDIQKCQILNEEDVLKVITA